MTSSGFGSKLLSMITVTKDLAMNIENFPSRIAAAREFDVSYPSLMVYLAGGPVSAAFIENVLGSTGWTFEKAFIAEGRDDNE